MLGVAVQVMTFGQWLHHLRRRESPTSVSKRINLAISAAHLIRLEEKPEPGGIRLGTLVLLAKAYWEDNYPSEEVAFWDLWQRAGYPLPLGFPPALSGIASDPKRYEAMRDLMDVVGSWRTDEIQRLAADIRKDSDPGAKRQGAPVVEPPIARIPGH